MSFELPGMSKHTSEISEGVLTQSTKYCFTQKFRVKVCQHKQCELKCKAAGFSTQTKFFLCTKLLSEHSAVAVCLHSSLTVCRQPSVSLSQGQRFYQTKVSVFFDISKHQVFKHMETFRRTHMIPALLYCNHIKAPQKTNRCKRMRNSKLPECLSFKLVPYYLNFKSQKHPSQYFTLSW